MKVSFTVLQFFIPLLFHVFKLETLFACIYGNVDFSSTFSHLLLLCFSTFKNAQFKFYLLVGQKRAPSPVIEPIQESSRQRIETSQDQIEKTRTGLHIANSLNFYFQGRPCLGDYSE